MMIRILDSRVVNRIAAGEVIERPASVVKELVENAIDAGASEIKIVIANGGRNLISVTDNGRGIAKEELDLALTRHATSKITDPDLLEIKYLGFRGEALPSIAAVSRLKLISRTREQETAAAIGYEGGYKIHDIKPEAMNIGTHVEVRDLFFATPNRLKFLKTERAESQYIVDIFNRLAMSYYNIEFSLSIDDKRTIKYPCQISILPRLSEARLLGGDFQHNSAPINIKIDNLHLTGHAGTPTLTRGKSTFIHTFINQRPIYDNLIIGAVRNAYSDFITRDHYPIVALYFDIPYDQVDVNVHPNKSEVRFQNKKLIYNLVLEGISQALSTSTHTANSTSHIFNSFINFDPPSTESTLNEAKQVDFRSWERFPTVMSPKQPLSITTQDVSTKVKDIVRKPPLSAISANKVPTNKLIADYPLGLARCQLYSTYIISQTEDSVIIVDQHAAHERLVYEYMKSINDHCGIKRQVLIIPELVELNPYEQERLLEFQNELLKLGLLIERLGDSAVLIREIPAILGGICAKTLVRSLVDGIFELGSLFFLNEKIKDVCATIACHSAIRAGRELKVDEMNNLLRKIENTPYSSQCNHGRPTYIKLSLKDLEKLFERR